MTLRVNVMPARAAATWSCAGRPALRRCTASVRQLVLRRELALRSAASHSLARLLWGGSPWRGG